MRSALLMLCGLVAGCGRFGFEPLAEGVEPTDGDVLGPDSDASSACVTSTTLVDTCGVMIPGPALELADPGTYIYDTDTGELVTPGGASLPVVSEIDDGGIRVLSLTNVTIKAEVVLRVIGSHPFAIVAGDSITVDGELDLAARFEDDGPGDGDCAAGTGGIDSGGGGGGGGAGFGAAGGTGGVGDGDNGGSPVGPSAGGLAGPEVTTFTELRGGCGGGRGGAGDSIGGIGGAGVVPACSSQTIA